MTGAKHIRIDLEDGSNSIKILGHRNKILSTIDLNKNSNLLKLTEALIKEMKSPKKPDSKSEFELVDPFDELSKMPVLYTISQEELRESNKRINEAMEKFRY